MTDHKRGWLTALTLGMAFLLPAGANAGPEHPHSKCPPSCYSCLHYWAPSLYRCQAFHRTPMTTYPPPPQIQPTFAVMKYPCPGIPTEAAANTYGPLPTFTPSAPE